MKNPRRPLWEQGLRGLLSRGAMPAPPGIEEERQNILSEKSDFFVRESYKTLRTNIAFALAGEDDCKVLIVTSAVQSEGKSITSVNLAISFAELGQRVLLVDCDLRRPKLARLLSRRGDTGLSNVLLQPRLLERAVCASGIPNLDLLFSGDIPPNPSELLGSPRMMKLIEDLREKYDYVILDTPPVNMVTDACVLVPESHGVVFVVRANYSDRNSVLHAVEQMEYSKAKILGFVLNGVRQQDHYYGYRKYGYGRYRRYGYYGREYQSRHGREEGPAQTREQAAP